MRISDWSSDVCSSDLDALFDRGAGGMQRIVDPFFLLLDLDFGRTADADHLDTAGKLGEPFLQLLAVIIAGGRLDLLADLRDASVDVGLGTDAVDDRGVVLVVRDFLGSADLA